MEVSAPQRLDDTHQWASFDCGVESINDYLHRRALKAQQLKHAAVYVVCFANSREVAGFYTLSNGSIARAHVAPRRLQRNSPDQHPVTILGRMGVTRQAQGAGLAVALLQDAIERSLIASEVIGSTALVVHPLDDRLAGFYAKYAGFQYCLDLSPTTMMLALR
ncbi:GNAT family N-acetyltransferase [Pseudomonas sp. NPDC007930]|uniref:GNAT family N-acetyltransferase n=1 Tax=Pseudomonas sp. NPDC007930 TaxID=3364417 RepID=UPI0036F06E1D